MRWQMAPGDLDLDVVVGGEQGPQPGGLFVGESVGAGVQGAPRTVQGILGAAAVAVEFLLDATAAAVERVTCQTDHVAPGWGMGWQPGGCWARVTGQAR